MKVKIRKVNKKNKKSVDAFVKKEWKKFGDERGYNYKEKKYSFAAYENKEILGFIKFKITGGVAYLSQLIVAKRARGKGIGDLLIKKFEKFSKEKGSHLAYLETSDRHKEAREFYKKHGYKIIAKFPNNKFHFTWYFYSKNLK